MNLAKLIFDANHDNENHLAFIETGYQLTYKELRIGSQNFADTLRALGIQAGDVLLISMFNSIDVPVIFFGCLIAGVKAAFVDRDNRDLLIEKDLRRASIINNRILIDGETIALDNSPNLEDSNLPIVYHDWDDDDVCIMLCTGGTTTGTGKLACHHHGTLMHIANTHKNLYSIDHSSVVMGTPKLNFGYGLAINMIMTMISGATSVIYNALIKGSTIFDMMKQHKVTHFFGNPTIYKILLSTKGHSLSPTVKYAISSSEPLPDIIIKSFRMLHGITILNAYGSSETITNCCILEDKEKALNGNIGKPLPGYKFKIVDDDLNECPKNQPGVLMIHCDQTARSYFQISSHENFRNGWYYTNDVVYQDDDGDYHFINRKNQYVKINSKWTSASIIEDNLLSLPEVDDCTVIFSNDQFGLLTSYAYVMLKPECKHLTQADIRSAILKKSVESQNVPGHVFFVGTLPRSERNKRVINKIILDQAVLVT